MGLTLPGGGSSGGSSVASQTGNAGKFLTTDGSTTSWATVAATGLTPTATKTGAYTVAVGQIAMMNVPGGATALALPAAPADKAQVGYRAIGATTAVPLVITCGGSDTIGTAGATTASIPLADEVAVLQYDAPNTRWLAVSNVKTQASLDARYQSLAYRVPLTRPAWTNQGMGWPGLPGVKLLGANVTVKPTHTPTGTGSRVGVWGSFYIEWDWAGWIKPQIDHCKAMGGNVVRIIGDIYAIKAGTLSQATYLAHWAQLIDYCASIGMYVHATVVGAMHTNSATQAELAAHAAAFGAVINRPNVVACDLYQEANMEYAVGSGGFTTTLMPIIAAMSAAVKAAAPNVPITVSSTDMAVAASWFTSLDPYVDLWEMHDYSNPEVVTAFDTLYQNNPSRKPVVIGEAGVNVSIGVSPGGVNAYIRFRQVLAERPEVVGFNAWALADQNTVDSDKWGLWADATDGSERTAWTDELKKFPRRMNVPYTVTIQPTADYTIPSGVSFYDPNTSAISFYIGEPVTCEVTATADMEIVTAGNIYSLLATVDTTSNASAPAVGSTFGGPARREQITITYSIPLARGQHTFRLRVAHASGSAGDGKVYAANTVANFKLTPQR